MRKMNKEVPKTTYKPKTKIINWEIDKIMKDNKKALDLLNKRK